MKVIIAGTRRFTDYNFIEQKCDNILKNIKEPIEIVSGGARGVDKAGEIFAEKRGHQLKIFHADWQNLEGKPEEEIGIRRDKVKYWKKAGIVRNGQMADYADALIAFWDGKSDGTRNMIEQAESRNLKVRVIRIKKPA